MNDDDLALVFRPFHVDDYVLVVDADNQTLTPARIVRVGQGAYTLVQYDNGSTYWVPKRDLELDLDKMRPILYDEQVKKKRLNL